jgi:hypothetical protein
MGLGRGGRGLRWRGGRLRDEGWLSALLCFALPRVIKIQLQYLALLAWDDRAKTSGADKARQCTKHHVHITQSHLQQRCRESAYARGLEPCTLSMQTLTRRSREGDYCLYGLAIALFWLRRSCKVEIGMPWLEFGSTWCAYALVMELIWVC